MNLKVERLYLRENCTIGKLTVDGVDLGYLTLEDKVRPPGCKVPGETAIPTGKYKVIISRSEHFGRDLPEVLDVPDFVGVRIHPGNTAADTEGCILVGKDWMAGDQIGRSREAFEELFNAMKKASSIDLEVV